jgi:DNA-directed RNA polymerase specialized sigma24 family protein
MAQKDLRRVQRVAAKMARAKQELRDAILAAYKSGESVRDIAPFAGVSPSRVHELLKEAQRLERDGGEPR